MDYNTALKTGSFLKDINAGNFDNIALEAFRYQYQNNELYRHFVDALHVAPSSVDSIMKIPFLPISFFKTHTVISGTEARQALVFESSGTTGADTSKHCVTDAGLYEANLLRGFRHFYGQPEQYVFLALLPSYLERENASLAHMAGVLIRESGHRESGFYLNEYDKLHEILADLEVRGQGTILLGVTFALLDFVEKCPMELKHTIVMETGGMKGRRQEMTRTEVHDFIKKNVKVKEVHSEYGMTELLSQAYAPSGGIFKPSPTMKLLVRDINDPMDVRTTGTGSINVIDLANINSCCFIATEDIGNIYAEGEFEVLGRMDHAMLRGCSLMVI